MALEDKVVYDKEMAQDASSLIMEITKKANYMTESVSKSRI